MNMHPLNLTDEPAAQPTQPAVDATVIAQHNQRSAGFPTVAANQTTSSKFMKKRSPLPLVLTILLTVGLGVATGFALNKFIPAGSTGSGPSPLAQVATGTVKNGDVFGTADSSTFKDTAEGYLEAGGLDGEGSHRLLREGGASQTVYLTSSVTDLSKLEGMQVKVWGETFRGQKAGWLMDVGRIEVINVEGNQPGE